MAVGRVYLEVTGTRCTTGRYYLFPQFSNGSLIFSVSGCSSDKDMIILSVVLNGRVENWRGGVGSGPISREINWLIDVEYKVHLH